MQPKLRAALEQGDPTLFRQLFDAHFDALLLTDSQGIILLANPAASRILGYSPQSLLGCTVESLVPPHLRADHAGRRETYADRPVPRRMGGQNAMVALHADGHEVTIEMALSPVQLQGESCVLATIRDVGDFPRVRQAERQAHHYAQLAELSRQAVDLTDPQELLQRAPALVARALDCEGAVVFLLDSDRRELVVANCFGLVGGRYAGERVPNDPRLPAGFVVAQAEVVVVPDWTHEHRFQAPPSVVQQGLQSGLAVPVFDQGQVVGVFSVGSLQPDWFGEDAIRFLQAAASVLATSLQRAQAESALRQAHKMESIGKLTGGIAHDFNNLLTVIQGNLQMAQEYLEARGDTHGLELIHSVAKASRRAADLTGNLLAFSRRQMLTPSRVDLGKFLPSFVELVRRTLGERIAIEMAVAADCPPCLVDKLQLESALLNIAINARDAMPDGGTLRFTCSGWHGHADAAAESAAAASALWTRICVTDTGVGMTRAVRDRAFEPFFSTKSPGRGTGLGLSSVYGFVRQSRGSITLDSAPGTGTTVTLLLPALKADATQESEAASVSEALPMGLRVLLVEDDVAVRDVAQRFLESLRCCVSAHASVQPAWEALNTGAEFDLLMTDIELGTGVNGAEFARQVRLKYPAMPVLLSSGYANLKHGEHVDHLEHCALLKKPFTRKELAAALARALAVAR